VFQVRRFDYAQGTDWLRQRVEKNWAELIPPAREIIDPEYRAVKKLLAL
jgi:hypothetical protein